MTTYTHVVSAVLAASALIGCSGGGGSGAPSAGQSSPASSSVGMQATATTTGAPSGPATSIQDRGAPDEVPADRGLGRPLPGLTQSELDAFDRGRIVFERRFRPSEGLGPFYNATSCQSCHSVPETGGSAQLYRNFYMALAGPPGSQFPMIELTSPVIPAFGSGPHVNLATFTLEGERVGIPDTLGGSNVHVAQRNGISVFGTGLFEFISDATILSNADPNDMDGDGVSGRYNTDLGNIGRFGLKAQANNIEIFTRAPLINQLGITSDPFMGSAGTVSYSLCAPAAQGTFDPDIPTTDGDGVPDPEIATSDLADLIAFSRFLAPPKRLPFNTAAAHGERLFEAVGCAKCHIPTLPSSRGPVNAYTDLLIHNMGNGLADRIHMGVPQPSSIDGSTTGQEWRTAPLWGVSLHGPWLHDGRAETLDEAIRMHGGEGQTARDAYDALEQSEKDAIIAFLEHI